MCRARSLALAHWLAFMVASPSIAPDVPSRSLPRIVWFNALVGISFIAFMVLPIEAATAWVGGSFMHSAIVGWGIAAIIIPATLYWLLGPALRHALSAELDLYRITHPLHGAGTAPVPPRT